MYARGGAGRTFLHRCDAVGDDRIMHWLTHDSCMSLQEKIEGWRHECSLSEIFVDAVHWERGERNFGACVEAFPDLKGVKDVEGNSTWHSHIVETSVYVLLRLDLVSRANGFNGAKEFQASKNYTFAEKQIGRALLHSVIIHKHALVCSTFLREVDGSRLSALLKESIALHPRMCVRTLRGRVNKENLPIEALVQLICLELAAIAGDVSVLSTLLKFFQLSDGLALGTAFAYKELDARTREGCGAKAGGSKTSCPVPLLPLAVASGKYDVLQLLLDKGHDPIEQDVFGNTVLHYATKGIKAWKGELLPKSKFTFDIHLMDYVHCEHILLSKEKRKRYADNFDRGRHRTEEALVGRQGCINLLIHEGCDIFKSNHRNKFPYLTNVANFKFHLWWHKQLAKEFAMAQSAQSMAAHAISMTAALVAITSYVGPLQSPLGSSVYNSTELRLGITEVKAFMICSIMSFYLAIVAIISALVPCLSMPQQSMTHELFRTKYMVNVGVAMLFPSIICILMAFAAASISVIQNRGLAIGTVLVGGFICLIVIGIISIRVLAIIFHSNKRIKSLYYATSFESLGDTLLAIRKCAQKSLIGKLMRLRDTSSRNCTRSRFRPLDELVRLGFVTSAGNSSSSRNSPSSGNSTS